jgi:Fe2+ or Zn2+ uptake regulation protein
MYFMSTKTLFADTLRKAGFRATSGKLAVLTELSKQKLPISIGELSKKLQTKANIVTLYRALDELTAAGLVRRVDLQHSHAHYEIVSQDEHHHHLICRACGAIEDVDMCGASRVESKILANSKKFASIETHTMEFFGVCRSCITT